MSVVKLAVTLLSFWILWPAFVIGGILLFAIEIYESLRRRKE